MTPHRFADLFRNNRRQSERERELEIKIEHAVAFAFSPVRHPVKTYRGILRFFRNKDRQSS
jgi:hypothetical protein